MGINHYYPTNPTTPPEPGEEAICGHIVTGATEAAIITELQTYCKVCLEAVQSASIATLFAESDI